MPGKTPSGKDNQPNGNGIDGVPKVDMKEDTEASKKGAKGKATSKGDMTVVVPPSKSGKAPESGIDAQADGDITMEDAAVTEEVDPVAQAISGKCRVPSFYKARANHSSVVVIKNNFALLEKAVALFDARYTLRALRSVSTIRKNLTADILAQVITETYQPSSSTARNLLVAIGKENSPFSNGNASAEMDIDTESKRSSRNSAKKESNEVVPEIDIYLAMLVQVYFLDNKENAKGAHFSTQIIEQINSLNRRTLDSLAAKVYFYFSLFTEQSQPLPPSSNSPVISIRPILHSALRTAVLRKDVDTQATIITTLLRNYLSTSHITQADLLISHTQFPETASNNQVARYLFYLGRIRAIQLRYTEAHEHLTAATRKAPSSPCAGGFVQTATKLLLVVELLMGDIPERATFRMPNFEKPLAPYLSLVQAVRVGNLEDFETTVSKHTDQFRHDGTYTLILRLRQNVIKTGIRMMSLSYSRISLRDICIRLKLTSEESAEYIVAKAIRDGVIEASLDREHGYMKSKEVGDVYATREPGEAFHDRIRACLALHDESVKVSKPFKYYNLVTSVLTTIRLCVSQ